MKANNDNGYRKREVVEQVVAECKLLQKTGYNLKRVLFVPSATMVSPGRSLAEVMPNIRKAQEAQRRARA